ncbi:Tyrosine-protein kinase-like otk [Tribolium castaneum]|uniref:Tyrosine-protein kinase-like otk n=1 Tax=Tribolium castaneum TaxID=7070 RepID=A0A139WLU9_TRICA|nr:PREDICTED: tyrosine-protein kinase-like otk [Tribolium castaneum]KYB28864.1 Tyrosine-protein kinase-like otk [Tribolium castaneum]|eukprot:XP_972111.1 PREDICTED: tyrosine-protein kinase-like otk [Tribolium castaneum]
MPGFNLIFFLLVLVHVVIGKEDPYFSESPRNVDVVQGKSVTLPCKVTPGIGMTYYWELNGSKIANTTRRHQQGSNLHITRVDRERDSGQFTCIAEDSTSSLAGSIRSSEASLNIQWIDEVSVQLQEPESASFISRGSDVTLRCHTDASGDVHYEWFRNSDRLLKSDKIEIKKKRLHIKNVGPSDNGVYRCLANNTAGARYSTTNFALAVAGEETALIQVVPRDQLVPQGGTAYFDCQYQQAEVTEWYFKKDTRPLENGKKFVIHSNGTLQINDVQGKDQGFYSCVGIRSESTEIPQSYIAELKLAYLSEFTVNSFEPPLSENSNQVVAPEGGLFQLTCLEPDSLPPAKKWWLNTGGHTVSDSGEVRVDDGRLIIEKVRMDHAGNYTCVAENMAGKTEKIIELVVLNKPVVTAQPLSVTVDENEPSMLTCDYEPKNHFTIVKWRKDGKSLRHDFGENSLDRQRIKIFKHNASLVIRETESHDRGEYVCEVLAKGFEPVLSEPATISVIEKLKFVPPPVNKKLELGSVAKVHCKAQGTPPPIITWEKLGESFDNSRIISMNGTLVFNGVLNEDKGKYTCVATNSQGVINVTINIDVVVAPKFSVEPKNPTEVTEGQSVTIDCVVEGDPKPTIHWDKNLKMNDFDHSRFTVLENGTLFISEVHREDENKYGCTAGNSAGLNRQEVQLIVHSRDGYHPDGDSTVTKAVLITMSVAGAYIVLVIGLMVWCRYRRRSRKLPVTDAAKTENGEVDHTELKDGANGHCSGTSKVATNGLEALKEGQKSDGAETTHSQSSNQSKKSKSNYDKLALSRTHLKEMKLIGRGEFGEVMVAKMSKSALLSEKRNSQATTPPIEDKELPVLVKALSHTKDENSLSEFKREIDMFLKLSHENITKIYGLCREAEPHYMILEHTDWGDLKQFLVATQKGSPPPLTPVQCVAIVHQLCQGLDHLATSRLIHRDLAARNCLVTSTLKAKVGLPRLTRDPYSQEYCKHVNHIIPLRWLPYEAVYEDEYSTKSDVYSFAVVIWEIFNQGELPFPKMNDTSFLNKLKEKKLEWKPHSSTPESLQKLQASCWDSNPQNRPTFSELAKEIEEVLKSM